MREFREWIKDAENASSISLDEAKQQWAITREGLIMKERENYLSGKGKSYSWEEVKNMALTGKERQILSDLGDAVTQVNLHKEGKIKLNTLQQVLDKL